MIHYTNLEVNSLTQVNGINVEALQGDALDVLMEVHKKHPEALPFIETMDLSSEGEEGGEDEDYNNLPIIPLKDVNRLALKMMFGNWVDMYAHYKEPYLRALIAHFEEKEQYEYCGAIVASIREWDEFNKMLTSGNK